RTSTKSCSVTRTVLTTWDEPGRAALEVLPVLMTADGAKNLRPRSDVRANIKPWLGDPPPDAGGKKFEVTNTPREHLPGGKVTGFSSWASFGTTDGEPNVIYFSSDTIHLSELTKMKMRFRMHLALLNIAKATAPLPTRPMVVTIDRAEDANLFQELEDDVLVPMHFEFWVHFAEKRNALAAVLGVRIPTAYLRCNCWRAIAASLLL
ncbi:uncharacterized protein P884DRAFT_312291, partial [Thermothelomyces heterothallicus CBS 202.75]|uniref:uncharacterized protein n=1 Tax=Thermothelomyces heterothallicus CBS 202.75 TaxID=1149848 RepID=UPI003742C558